MKLAMQHADCMAASWHPISCDGAPIRAHAVSKEQSLARIARNGKVYQLVSDPGSLMRFGAPAEARLRGVGQATTFPGFCALHDGRLFRDLDLGFTGTERELLAVSFRAVAREAWGKRAAADLIARSRSRDAGHRHDAQRHMQSLISAQDAWSTLGKSDIDAFLDDLVEMIQDDACRLNWLIIDLDRHPGVMAASSVYPEYDLLGDPLQDLASPTDRALLAFTSQAADNGGAVAFMWRPIDDDVCVRFAQSALRLNDAELPNAIAEFLFGSCESLAICPDWWEALPERARFSFQARFNDAADPSAPLRCNWTRTRRMTTTTWVVRGRRSNVPALGLRPT
jgi:hypothetical protein